MGTLQDFVDQGWNEHVGDAVAVAMRLPQGLEAVDTEADLQALARLSFHVYGLHLGRWADALKFNAALARGPGYNAEGDSGALLRRQRTALALAAGEGDARETLETSDRIAATALAAEALGLHDAARSQALLDEAVAAERAAALADDDPAVRALAAAGNNVSAHLEDQAARSPAQAALMVNAAIASRDGWARCGTWLQAERAEYRVASSCLTAGDAARALPHARACLATIDAQPEPQPFERFYACEVLARALRATGDTAGHAQALLQAREAFDALSPADQAACQATLDAAANA